MNRERIFLVTIMALFLSLMINSCNKDDDEPDNPFNGKTTAVFNPDLSYGTMTDQEGNEYKTITIGTQTWMSENLRTTKYRDGSEIPNVTDSTEWIELTTGACCNYNNTTNADTIATYGRLYNWYAVNDARKIAPTGWHVPTDAEWTTLIAFLGGEDIASGKMKETGTSHWISPNAGATNESGITALPLGNRSYYDGRFINLSYYCLFWSSTNIDTTLAWHCEMYYWDAKAYSYGYWKTTGCSVRLIKD